MRVLLAACVALAFASCGDDSGSSGEATREACAAFRDVEDDFEFEETREVVLADLRTFTQEANRAGDPLADLAHDYRTAILDWFDKADRSEAFGDRAVDEAFDEAVAITERIANECGL